MKLVFLNCFLRPGILFHDKQSERIKMIPEYTIQDNRTIIGLCEVFTNRHHRKLQKEFNDYGYELIEDDYFSGLGLAYNPKYFRLLRKVSETYSSSKMPDSFSQKGIMMCVVEDLKDGKQYNIIITHLQSNYHKKDDDKNKKGFIEYETVQYEQLIQLYKFIRKRRLKNYILMGDFNIDPDCHLAALLYTLFNNNYKSIAKSATFPEDNVVLDYIFIPHIKNYKTQVLKAKEKKILRKFAQNSSHNPKYISDHYAICVDI